MKVIKPSYVILDNVGPEILKKIEVAGRTCYKSEGNIGEGTDVQFVQNIIKRGHESVLEHEKISVRIICDRGVSHELVRHRIASFSQESTRYCNYGSEKHGGELTFIDPCFWEPGTEPYNIWLEVCQNVENSYLNMTGKLGVKPEEARSILPNSIKTEIVVTMNLREWRHFFKLRTSIAAHPQMREITRPMLDDFKKLVPVVFDDITYE